MRGKMCLGIAASLCVVWCGSAGAAPVDVASEHVALRAFDHYVRALVSEAPAERQSADAFVMSISASCPNVLAGSGFHQTGPASRPVIAFAVETGLDIAVTASVPRRVPLARMTMVLSKLRWSSNQTKATVTHFLASERKLNYLAPSGLCADASALAANPKATPSGTAHWVTRAVRALRAANSRSNAFVKTLLGFSDAADAPVLKDLVRDAKRVGSVANALANAEEPKLLTALGISP